MSYDDSIEGSCFDPEELDDGKVVYGLQEHGGTG